MLKIRVVIICLICLHSVDGSLFCYEIELPKGLIQNNIINVIYTMRSSCKNCTQKVNMFPSLKASLEKEGIKVNFIVAVSHNSHRLSGLIPLITVNRRQVWKELGEQNDHFFIIDRCGRMVYEIIKPWSSLQLPFLRGAIRATHGSHPCGLCPQDYKLVSFKAEEEELKTYPPIIDEYHSGEESPLDIIMKSRHVHEGDPNVYNYIVLTTHGKPGYHRHLPHEHRRKTKSSFSLNVLEDNKETYESPSYSSDIKSDNNNKNGQLSAEQTSTSNSITNLDYQRMADKKELVLHSSGSEHNIVSNKPNPEIQTSTEISSLSEEEFTSSDCPETPENSESSKEENKLGSDLVLNTSGSEHNTVSSEPNPEIETSTKISGLSEEEFTSSDYPETDENSESSKENNKLGSDEIYAKESSGKHYNKILDWI